MVQKHQSELQLKAEKEKEEVKQPHKNETKAVGNGDKKVELIACQREGGKQFLIYVLGVFKRLGQDQETVTNVISKQSTTQIHQNEKDRGYEIRKEGTGDDDQLFHGQELYHYKDEDTSHRIGHLVVDDYHEPDLLSGKLLRLLSQVCLLEIVGSISGLATGLILNKAESVGHRRRFFTPTAKDANNQEHVSDLQQAVEHYYFNSGLKDSYEMEDIPEQGKNQKKTPPLGSGNVLKKHAEDVEQYLPSEKNSPLYKSGRADCKKNILYLTEESYFNARHGDMTYDQHTSIEMVVSDQGYCRSVIMSRRSYGSAPVHQEIIHITPSKTYKHFVDSEEVRRKRPSRFGVSWIDSDRGIPGSSGGEMKVKQKELEDFEINGIDNKFPDHGDLKKRKNSIDQFPDRLWIDPMLKIGVALLIGPDLHASHRTSQQGQDCAVTEESHPAEENHGEGQHEAAGQSLSAEDSEKHKASCAEGGEACHAKQQDAEQLADCSAGSAATATDHGKDTHTGGGAGQHSLPLEDSSCQSVSTGTRVSDSQSRGKETPWERGTSGKRAVPEAVSSLRHDQSRGMESTATGNASGSACCVKDAADLEEDGSAEPHTVGHEVDKVPPETPPALPVSQTCVERTTDCGTPQTLSVPVQVSSSGISEISYAGCSEFCADETYEKSFVPTPDEGTRPDCTENSHPVTGAQESQQSCRHTSVFAQEQASYFHVASPAEHDSNLEVAEEMVYAFTSHYPQEQPACESHPPSYPPPVFQNSIQLESRPGQQPCPVPPSQHVPMQSESLLSNQSPAQAGTGSHPPSPQHLPPVTVPPSQSLPVGSESLLSNQSPAQSGPGSHPGSVSQPTVTVHAASSLPPQAPRTARINLSLATNRNFVLLRTRRATFGKDWPGDEHSGIDVTNMALSGFYIEDPGRGHRVRCFYCGLVLDYLTSAHNIWDEHVRHSPDCVYLKALMGSDFVQETLRNLHDHDHDPHHSQAP